MLAYRYSKGWYISRLKEMGISHHPVKHNKLELYKIYILRNLYNDMMDKKEKV